MNKLYPVSHTAMLRLRDLAAMAPLRSTSRTYHADTELEKAGWITIVMMPHDDGVGVDPYAEMSEASVRKDGHSCLFDDHGSVHACWKK